MALQNAVSGVERGKQLAHRSCRIAPAFQHGQDLLSVRRPDRLTVEEGRHLQRRGSAATERKRNLAVARRCLRLGRAQELAGVAELPFGDAALDEIFDE